uniref:Uncharacterized protein n=1 Tax=Arundo donax TaxID=35708 RepID=A0A0A9A9C7_ARUDO
MILILPPLHLPGAHSLPLVLLRRGQGDYPQVPPRTPRPGPLRRERARPRPAWVLGFG